MAGRYEGIDQRVAEALIDEELSIGDYVLSGGELPALVVIDAVARLLPGVLGHGESRRRIRSGTGCSTGRTTRGRRTGKGGRCPRCCGRQPCRHPPLAADAGAGPDLAAAAGPAAVRSLTRDERALLEEYCAAAGIEPPRGTG